MKISLCTVLYNPVGDALFEASEDSNFTYLSRRLTRTATLDGGAVIIDNGFAPADGTIKITVNPANNSAGFYAQIAAILKQFGMVTIASREGIFLAAIESVSNDKTVLNINLLIKSQLA